MKISVITPTFNSENTISANVSSIIKQTYRNFEHIIVDNKSSDATLEIIRKIYTDAGFVDKLKIISEKDSGISDAFNKGILSSTGNIIAILNSDDEYFNNNVFEKAVEVFKDPEILFLHGDIFFADQIYGTSVRQPIGTKMMAGYQYNHPTMIVRKELYEKIGFYNTDFKISMDFEFYCRIAKNYNPQMVSVYLKNEPLVRMNAGGESWKNELLSIKEIKTALIMHGFWNLEGKKYYYLRIIRTRIKKLFSAFKLHSLVRLWRRFKWRKKILI